MLERDMLLHRRVSLKRYQECAFLRKNRHQNHQMCGDQSYFEDEFIGYILLSCVGLGYHNWEMDLKQIRCGVNHIDAKWFSKGSNISRAWIVLLVWFGQTYNNVTQAHHNFWFMRIDLQQWAQVILVNDFRVLGDFASLCFCLNMFAVHRWE